MTIYMLHVYEKILSHQGRIKATESGTAVLAGGELTRSPWQHAHITTHFLIAVAPLIII